MLPIAILTIWKYTCKYQIISLYEDIRTKLIQSGVNEMQRIKDKIGMFHEI